MNKALVAALVGIAGLALGVGAGWAWDSMTGDDMMASETVVSPTP